SKTDFLYFMRGFTNNSEDRFINDARLKAYKAEELMTAGLAKLDTFDSIASAVEIFKLNRFHAVPIMENNGLVGIVTTHDIIKHLAEHVGSI
ncbi:MAG: CBS domain-containing protein, partial [Phaeodactylibacter sp.]|nr:CBS domain-containing protein [Phaeodactylibacter sp.]